MKFVKEDIAGLGHKRCMFAVGKFEAEILLGLLKNGLHHTPKTPHTNMVIARMKNMKNVIGESLARFSPGDGYPSVPEMPDQKALARECNSTKLYLSDCCDVPMVRHRKRLFCPRCEGKGMPED